MFKNALIFRISPSWTVNLELIESGLESARFTECGASQERSVGWAPPRGEAHGALVESVAGQLVLKLMMEVKSIPSSVINRKAEAHLVAIEASSGRKPGKREIKEVKDDIKLTLMPLAFTKLSTTLVWIDPQAQLVMVNAASRAKADEVLTLLVKCLNGFSVLTLNTRISPAVAMADWLSTRMPPAGFTIDRECELKSPDESKAVVRYARHPLDIEEVSAHVSSGKVPTKLALTWMSRVSFILTDLLQLKKIEFLESALEDAASEDNAFDADVAIFTGELRRLIPELIHSLGGELLDVGNANEM